MKFEKKGWLRITVALSILITLFAVAGVFRVWDLEYNGVIGIWIFSVATLWILFGLVSWIIKGF